MMGGTGSNPMIGMMQSMMGGGMMDGGKMSGGMMGAPYGDGLGAGSGNRMSGGTSDGMGMRAVANPNAVTSGGMYANAKIAAAQQMMRFGSSFHNDFRALNT